MLSLMAHTIDGVVLCLLCPGKDRRPTHSGLFNLITDLYSRSQHSLIITWKVRHGRVVVLLQFMKPKWKTEAFLIKNDRLLSLLSFFLIQKSFTHSESVFCKCYKENKERDMGNLIYCMSLLSGRPR